MADIFISYSRKDRDRAERLADALTRQGWSVWWDRKIAAGESFDRSIEHELDAAKCAIVLWTHDSVESEWVKNEAAAAVERGVLVPVLLDAVRPPLEFRRKQTIDLSGWDGDGGHAALAALFEGVAARLGAGPAAPPSLPPAARSRWPRGLMLGAGAAVALAAVAAGLLLSRPADSETVDLPTFTMVCASGGPFEFRKNNAGAVRVGFGRAHGTAAQGLLPGQCSWTDRALNANEPETLCDRTKAASRLVEQLSRADTQVRLQVYFDASTSCFRVVRFSV
jgi:hypothetical protein